MTHVAGTTKTLQVRDARAWVLAKELADIEGDSMTAVVLAALEARLAAVRERRRLEGEGADSLRQRLAGIVDAFNALPATRPPEAFDKDEIDAMWGQ